VAGRPIEKEGGLIGLDSNRRAIRKPVVRLDKTKLGRLPSERMRSEWFACTDASANRSRGERQRFARRRRNNIHVMELVLASP
jgi:hypothetical protein